MLFLDNLLSKIKCFKCLKLVYALLYVKSCILVSYTHLLINIDNYSTTLNVKNLTTDVLNKISDNRGIKLENKYQSTDKSSLEKLIVHSGKTFNTISAEIKTQTSILIFL